MLDLDVLFKAEEKGLVKKVTMTIKVCALLLLCIQSVSVTNSLFITKFSKQGVYWS